ncbi:MAG: metalloregulator ArsR/SmtB family transcription factor [Desulforhopalus sp.]|nr:metalloregulator ArsR/SmtB family transcription factor [Desulforhopalus sp.]
MIQLHYDTDVCEGLCEHDQVVCMAKAEMLLDEDARQIAETFKILGDPTRIKILHALSRRELCVCDIAAIVAMGQSAVSHQLRLLRGARLVKYRKEGKMVWYSLDDTHISLLLAQGIEHIQHR